MCGNASYSKTIETFVVAVVGAQNNFNLVIRFSLMFIVMLY